MDISTKFVLHKDVTIDVKKDGRKLGTALLGTPLASSAKVNTDFTH